jgi:hypothetical protein
MARPPKKDDKAPEVDPKRGDAILRRMLQTKPKQHKDMVAERHKQPGNAPPRSKRGTR